MAYDAFGRKASETNPNSETIAYEYPAAGQDRMTALVDANALGNRRQPSTFSFTLPLTTEPGVMRPGGLGVNPRLPASH
jgi:YD repeat-containing protein